jgi:hypothetical protein
VKLIVEYVYPPIPIRQFDYAVYDDNTYCGCGECRCVVGTGATRDEAFDDFVEQMELTEIVDGRI